MDLILLQLHDFDIILGMHWLATHHVLVGCFAKRVTFRISGQPKFCFEGSSSHTSVQLILVMKDQSLLKKGYQGYLAYVVENDKDVKLDDISTVKDYPYVSPEEVPRLPPKREVEFTNELVSGMTPISKAPYQMAPLELNELKAQLQKMLDKGFIRPCVSSWRGQVLFIKKNDGTLRLCSDFMELNKGDL